MYTRLLLLPMLAAPFSLTAQDSTARALTPFRRGQWATQFAIGSGFTSLGFLKFRSPTRALVFDLQLGGGHRERLIEDSTGSHFLGLDSEAFTQVRFGWRGYRGSATKVVAHYTIGVRAGFDHNAGTGLGSSVEYNTWTGGVFGDLGATYLVTPQLGLGVLGSAGLSYLSGTQRGEQQNGTVTKSRSWQIGGSAVAASLVATLFF
ncbi:MAG TPA: hypothetical protein VFO67_20445 [Gemmatimonadales bacterium]|nr:hypothetical protein [Gemmatimonadales bacterium]